MADAPVTIKLVGGVPGIHDVPELLEHVDRWLVRYEPTRAYQGVQWLWTTDDREQAATMSFPEALKLLKTPIGIRQDGKPDRPITVFHIQIARVGVEEVQV